MENDGSWDTQLERPTETGPLSSVCHAIEFSYKGFQLGSKRVKIKFLGKKLLIGKGVNQSGLILEAERIVTRLLQ